MARRDVGDVLMLGLLGYISVAFVTLGAFWIGCSIVIGPLWAAPFGLFAVGAGAFFGWFTVVEWRDA